MFSLNRVHIVGYQTQPVELRQTPGGASVTDLNLVVPVSFTGDNGQQIESKSFHTVTLWGSMADFAGQYVRPGTQVFIGGRLQTDSWDDEQSGEKRSKTKIVSLDFILLDPKDGQLAAPQNAGDLMRGVNNAEVIGNLTREPEMRTTTNGQQVVSLGVATNERWKDRQSGEDRERTEFHNIVVWGALAEQVSSTLKKGQRVYVGGRVQTRSWETQSGAKRTTTEIVAERIMPLGTAHPVAQSSIQAGASAGAPAAPMNQAPAAESFDQSAPAEPAGDPVGVAVPEVNYTSEVKVEDLPF